MVMRTKFLVISGEEGLTRVISEATLYDGWNMQHHAPGLIGVKEVLNDRSEITVYLRNAVLKALMRLEWSPRDSVGLNTAATTSGYSVQPDARTLRVATMIQNTHENTETALR